MAMALSAYAGGKIRIRGASKSEPGNHNTVLRGKRCERY
jgi:hypothetical protein